VLDIDVRLAMRCNALLEEGQELEGMADFKGAGAKYQEMKSLGSHFQDKDMGAQVCEGAQEAISALPSVPLPPSREPEALTESHDTEGGDGVLGKHGREESSLEEESWAKYEAPSSLSFVKDMDARIRKRTLEAAQSQTKDSIDEQAGTLEAKISIARDEWQERNLIMVPNKKDPTILNAKCCFSNCNKVFKDKIFASKHLLTKHSAELNLEIWPIRRDAMLQAYARDESPPLPLVECSDGSSYPITVDPIDILRGKFVQPLPPPRPPRPPRQERDRPPPRHRSVSFGSARDVQPKSTTSHVKVSYVDADAPKTESVQVDYGSALQLAALPPKKKKRKKNKKSETDTEANE
jgi:hypothetical protein